MAWLPECLSDVLLHIGSVRVSAGTRCHFCGGEPELAIRDDNGDMQVYCMDCAIGAAQEHKSEA